MSYKNLAGQLALSAAVGFAGAANAQGINSTSVNISSWSIIQSGISAGQGQEGGQTPWDIQRLERISSREGGAQMLGECRQASASPKEPLNDIPVSDTRSLVDCVDQKILDVFLSDPSKSRGSVFDLVRFRADYAPTLMVASNDFAEKVASECKPAAGRSLNDFARCAAKLEDNTWRTYVWTPIFTLILCLSGGMGVSLVRREINDCREEKAKREALKMKSPSGPV